jgi:hypothetical protein
LLLKQACVYLHHAADNIRPIVPLGVFSGLTSEAITAGWILENREYPFSQRLWIPRGDVKAVEAVVDQECQAADL